MYARSGSISAAEPRARRRRVLLSKQTSAPRAFQEFRTKTRPLITLGFSGAEIRCKIAPMKYGYARVSTDGQSIDAQVRPSSTPATCEARMAATPSARCHA
jgi:hypothetical protein